MISEQENGKEKLGDALGEFAAPIQHSVPRRATGNWRRRINPRRPSQNSALAKALLLALATLVLFAYGRTGNSPPWDFGKLLGLYVVFFFLTAQAISWLAFKQLPSLAVLVGGLFILTGAVIVAIAGT